MLVGMTTPLFAALLAVGLQAQDFGGALPRDLRFTRAAAPPPAAASPAPGSTFKAKVLAVLDADTIVVDHGGSLEIRLAAVDAPEIAHPEHGKEGQPYGDEAAAFVHALCDGKTVTVTVAETDKYGRTVGSITLPGGKQLQEELLRNGWAWWNFFFNHDEALNKLENEAIDARRGLWAGKTRGGVYAPEAPWIFRRRIAAGLERLLPGAEMDIKITHMADADTAALGTRNGVYDYVRLAGVDAPEVSHGASKPAQAYGPEAAGRAKELVAAEGMSAHVRVEDVDPYGRIVGWIVLESRHTTLNEILLDEGYAWWYERYYPDRADLGKRQAAAQAARRGLWADPNPVPPWEFRRLQRTKPAGEQPAPALAAL